MTKASNRYLNLAGALYSPDKPKAAITLANYFTAVATSLTIFGAAYVNPTVNKNHLVYFGEGILGSAGALWFATKRRKEEAEKISSHFERLVIDKAPDNSTPPTSADILTRVIDLRNQYKGRSGLTIDSLRGATIDIFFGMADAQYLLEKPNPHWYAVAMPFFTIHAVDVFMRYRQFNKIANMKWVITDKGNAVRSFQEDEVKELANSPQIATAPAGPV